MRQLACHVAAVLTPSQAVVLGGVVWGEASEALSQGDTEALGLFCVGLQPHLIQLNHEADQEGKKGYGRK